jgi:hypothetical protein
MRHQPDARDTSSLCIGHSKGVMGLESARHVSYVRYKGWSIGGTHVYQGRRVESLGVYKSKH